MKTKLLLSLFVIAMSFSLIAQETETTNKFKPNTGDLSFEVDFLPFSTEGPIRLTAFRGRYFLKDNIAINLNFSYGQNKLHDESPYKYDDYMVFDTEDAKTNVFGLGTGLEYHFLKTARVSPYAGFQMAYEMKNSSSESLNNRYDQYPDEFTTTTIEVENAWGANTLYGYDQSGNAYYNYTISERGYNAFRFHLVMGADVYLMKHFYMGIEFGLGYTNLKYKEVIIKQEGNIETKFPEATESSFGFIYNNAIRLGFWF